MDRIQLAMCFRAVAPHRYKGRDYDDRYMVSSAFDIMREEQRRCVC